jgi:hypothetical protein
VVRIIQPPLRVLRRFVGHTAGRPKAEELADLGVDLGDGGGEGEAGADDGREGRDDEGDEVLHMNRCVNEI